VKKGSVWEVAEVIPGRAALGMETFVVGGTLDIAHDVADLEEGGGAFGGDAVGGYSSEEGAGVLQVVEFAHEITLSLARSAPALPSHAMRSVLP